MKRIEVVVRRIKMDDKRYQDETIDYRKGFVEGQAGERDAYLLLAGCADLEEYERGFTDGQESNDDIQD